MPPGTPSLRPEQVDRLLEVPKLDARSRAALMDHRDRKIGLPELRGVLREDPAVVRYMKTGGKFLKASARAALLAAFPEAAPEAPAAPKKPQPSRIPPPPAQMLPQDPGLDRLEQVLVQLTSRPDEAEATLSLKLHRIERAGGFDKKTFTGIAVLLRGEEIPQELMLEERTQEHAEASGRFGTYLWSITAKLGADVILDTTRTVTVEAPTNYRPPLAHAATAATQPPDPKVEARESLGLVKELVGVAAALGGGARGGLTHADLEAARVNAYREGKEAGEVKGKLDAQEAAQRILREEVERAEARGYERGKVDGRREAEDSWRDREKELEAAAGGEGPGTVERVVGMLGGPGVVSGLITALTQGLLSSKQPAAPQPRILSPAPPVRPPAQLVPQTAGPAPMPPAPVQAPAAPVQAPAVPPAAGEPTRAQYVEAVGTVQHLLNLLDEAAELRPDQSQALQPARKVAEDTLDRGLAEGSLAEWWTAWQGGLGAQLETLIQALEQELGRIGDGPETAEDPVNVDTMKAILLDRLEGGVSPEAIMAELGETVPASTLAEWRRALALFPDGAALRFLGIPDRHAEAARQVLATFKAAS
jgi:hypothetical protein